MNKKFITLFVVLAASFAMAGCEPEKKEVDGTLEGFYHQAPKKFLTYDERIQKKKYEECIDQQKADKNKEPCRVPDFLKD